MQLFQIQQGFGMLFEMELGFGVPGSPRGAGVVFSIPHMKADCKRRGFTRRIHQLEAALCFNTADNRGSLLLLISVV